MADLDCEVFGLLASHTYMTQLTTNTASLKMSTLTTSESRLGGVDTQERTSMKPTKLLEFPLTQIDVSAGAKKREEVANRLITFSKQLCGRYLNKERNKAAETVLSAAFIEWAVADNPGITEFSDLLVYHGKVDFAIIGCDNHICTPLRSASRIRRPFLLRTNPS